VEEDPFQLIMEFAEGGNLMEAIPNLLWENKRRIAGEIAHGLTYIHSQGIIHCDIKSPNVLLTKKLEVKICDFDCAMKITDKNKMPCIGTFPWQAPELQQDATAYSSKSDVYALGIVMWEMASGVEPIDRSQVLEQKLKNVPEDYLVAMQNCWDLDPVCRPETQDLSFLKYERGFDEEHERFLWAIRNGDMSKAVTITVAQSVSTDVKVDFDAQKMTVNYTLVVLNDPVTLKNTSTVESLLESANKGSDRSKAALALSYYESGQYSEALHFAQQVRHIPVACYVMGEMYGHGHGVDRNEGEARILHNDAAKGGFSKSQVLMGDGCARAGHLSKAVSWYRKAALKGDLEGQYSLGVMIYYGCGAPLDRKEGERWIRKAADQGHKDAEAGMGVVCMHLKDYSEAMKWCLKAGNPMSHYHIGVLYYNGGWGVEPNCAAAKEWFQKAADQRYGLAAFALAKMYREGEVGEKDLNMAMQQYRRGHEYGDIQSTNALALLLNEQRREAGWKREFRDLLKEAKERGSVLAEANLLLRYMECTYQALAS
jgi:TPR repeat protein